MLHNACAVGASSRNRVAGDKATMPMVLGGHLTITIPVRGEAVDKTQPRASTLNTSRHIQPFQESYAAPCDLGNQVPVHKQLACQGRRAPGTARSVPSKRALPIRLESSEPEESSLSFADAFVVLRGGCRNGIRFLSRVLPLGHEDTGCRPGRPEHCEQADSQGESCHPRVGVLCLCG